MQGIKFKLLFFPLILISTAGHSKESCLFESHSSKKPSQYIQFAFFTDHTKHASRFHFTYLIPHYDWELRLYWTYRAVICKMNEKILLCENQTFIGMVETEEVLACNRVKKVIKEKLKSNIINIHSKTKKTN